ncbi:Glycogenin-1 [Melipona quadrifasciata]|uniref:glycogenin glucosyltransferase n=1 Tax=Melipona quadrifasciata TaxID=166423 RepID=A0A0M8ZWU0_9HYME|nr:Glycogenin-1 [Melipona quadrifasciata]
MTITLIRYFYYSVECILQPRSFTTPDHHKTPTTDDDLYRNLTECDAIMFHNRGKDETKQPITKDSIPKGGFQDFEIQISTPAMTDTTAASIVTGPVRFFHSAGGTAFKLFQETVYLIFDAGRRAGHLFARHSSVNVNVLEMGMEVDLMGVQFSNRNNEFRYAWVTLATNDAYSLGALVLAHSLRRVGTKHELAVLITPGVTQTMREKLSAVFSVVMEVNVLDSKDEANLALLARPELGVTFTKLHCWRLTQYEKCVFLDADTLVVRNCDELFEKEELSAAPDVGWPDCFNSGVFVYKPSQQTFASITAFAAAKGSFDGGDQGLLNMYFSDWARKDISKHLPFIYNMCSTATYSYLPAFKQFGDDVRIIHFIGITKPWLQYFDTLTGIVQPPVGSAHLQPLLQLWWNIFCEKVHPQLSPIMATSTLAPIWHEFSPMPFESIVPRSPIYMDIQNKTQNDIHLEQPDFSEFQDPWENYYVSNDPDIYKSENNEREQYYSTINSSSPISVLNESLNSVHQTRSSLEYNGKSYHNQQYSENIENISSSFTLNHQNQLESNQLINETEQQHFSHSNDIVILNANSEHWKVQDNIEQYNPLHNVQYYHLNESQYQPTNNQHIPQNTCNRLVSEETNQHQHIEYKCNYQHSSNNNNKLLSKEIKHQHNEPYIDHHCNYYQMFDNVNNKQLVQHCEQENQTSKSLDININHVQTAPNNIAYQNNLSIKQTTEQNENMNVTDKRTSTLISTSPHPNSKPCTDFHNVATQSDSRIMDDSNSSNAGLAGALAQMTLGEPRSAQQIALEEHMRKQSWEQGQIDYMGRDSFDNIWKKICETLALAPPRLPSPPKETQKESTLDTTDKTDESVKSIEVIQSTDSVDEVDKGIAQATISHTEEQSLVNNVPITNVPTLSGDQKNEDDNKFSKKSGIETLDTKLPIQISHKEVAEFSSNSLLKETSEQINLPIKSSILVQSSSIEEQNVITSPKKLENKLQDVRDLKITVDIEETKQPNIRDEKHAKEVLTASEILTVSPVPIQVAESVLQVEPKESMSDSQIMPQEILSSTITPVHLTEVEDKLHINGSTSSVNFAQKKEKSNLNNSSTVMSIDTVNKLSHSEETSQNLSSIQQVQLNDTAGLSSKNLCIPEKSLQEQIVELEQQKQQDKKGESSTNEIIESIKISSEHEVTESLLLDKAPIRPSRTKELNAPSTSIQINAQDLIDQEKVIKKTGKKLTEKSVSEVEPMETTDGDSVEKKVGRKIVKKVTKKTKTKSEEGPNDSAVDSSSSNKQKKTIKVVKKGVKSSQIGVSDTTVPETPSSSTSDAPIPPKRKIKTATAKSATKKSDIEQ